METTEHGIEDSKDVSQEKGRDPLDCQVRGLLADR